MLPLSLKRWLNLLKIKKLLFALPAYMNLKPNLLMPLIFVKIKYHISDKNAIYEAINFIIESNKESMNNNQIFIQSMSEIRKSQA